MDVETINPATGQVEYRHGLMAPAQVDAVLAAAQAAFPAWSQRRSAQGRESRGGDGGRTLYRRLKSFSISH